MLETKTRPPTLAQRIGAGELDGYVLGFPRGRAVAVEQDCEELEGGRCGACGDGHLITHVYTRRSQRDGEIDDHRIVVECLGCGGTTDA